MMKEAYTGGSFIWHQDYGYWYMNGCLFPDMGTAFIAIDRCDEENGCLEVNFLERLCELVVSDVPFRFYGVPIVLDG